MAPLHVASILWVAWYASWLAAAVWRGPAVKTLGLHREALSRALTIVGVIFLFFHGATASRSEVVLWHLPPILAWALLGPIVLGFLFVWWARLHLGRLWSANITRKADHRVVDSGPYAVVRHPIYSGLILAAFSTAVMEGTVLALVGASLFALAFYLKARLEEQFLRRELGPAYDTYADRVAMLVPLARARHGHSPDPFSS